MLTLDGYVLVAARGVRMLSYGFLSVVLGLYLAGVGLSAVQIGTLFTVALAGGAATTVIVSFFADRWGRRWWLIASALLMTVGGMALAVSNNFLALLMVAALGMISPSGQEVGPFLSLEQASLSQVSQTPARVRPYAWYNLVGSLAGAFGALVAGVVPPALQAAGWTSLAAQRALVWAFGAAGLVLVALFAMLSRAVEVSAPHGPPRLRTGLQQSRSIVLRLSALFGVDAMAGGLVLQSLVAFWFHQRFGIGLERLGPLFFATNLLSALSFLLAARLADRFGLLNTMVFTHLPSNVLLALVPLMPSWPLAAVVLMARHALSQMDVPTRQAYTMALVAPEERAAAAGLTNGVRNLASSVAPIVSGIAFQTAATGLPFVLSGGLKSAYDIAIWLTFRKVPLGQGGALQDIPGVRDASGLTRKGSG